MQYPETQYLNLPRNVHTGYQSPKLLTPVYPTNVRKGPK
jgi:hypothetical protein